MAALPLNFFEICFHAFVRILPAYVYDFFQIFPSANEFSGTDKPVFPKPKKFSV